MFRRILIFVGASFTAGALAQAPGYDEAYDRRGRPRPAYAEFARAHGANLLRPRAGVIDAMLGQPLGDSNKALPIPLVFARAEYFRLRRAVAERAEVLREFFFDIVMGEQRIFAARDAHFRAIVEMAFARARTSLEFVRQTYRGHPRGQVRFLYAPDLMRQPDGRWVVIEDNVGGLPGGFADQDPLRERFLHASGVRLPTSALIEDVLEGFADLTRLPNHLLEIVVEPTSAEYLEHRDDEQRRVVAAAEGSGVDLAFASATEPMTLDPQEGRYGLINWVNLRGCMNAADFVKTATAVGRGEIELFECLGAHALSDKTLLPFVDGLAQFYFGRALALRSPPTAPVSTAADLGRFIEAHGEDVVVKAGAGAGGSEVFFWARMNAAQRARLVVEVEEEVANTRIEIGAPAPAYVAQAVITPSHLPVGPHRHGPRATIDLRPITYVGPTPVLTPSFFWGRATTPFGDRRTNVGQGAMQLVVLPACAGWLTEG